MSRRANPAAVGGFVIGAVMLMVAAVVVFASANLFKPKLTVVSYFPGSVKGLQPGAAVEFRGVQIGRVTDINLLYHRSDQQTAIAVFMELWPDRVVDADPDSAADVDGEAELDDLIVNRGLRSQLELKNLVTGQLVVTLDFRPETPFEFLRFYEDQVEIPAVASTMDRLTDVFRTVDLNELVRRATNTLVAIEQLAASPDLRRSIDSALEALKEARELIAIVGKNVDTVGRAATQTLGDFSTLARSTDESVTAAVARMERAATRAEQALASVEDLSTRVSKEVSPVSQSVRGAFDQARSTFETVEGMVSEDSRTRYNLDVTLEELASAARAFRILAEFLEQNPDALIRGKYQ